MAESNLLRDLKALDEYMENHPGLPKTVSLGVPNSMRVRERELWERVVSGMVAEIGRVGVPVVSVVVDVADQITAEWRKRFVEEKPAE